MNDVPETYSRFPRTLDEAFRTARYADPIERHGRTGYPPLWWLAMWVAAIFAIAIAWATA